jgi:hypothetical protein
VILGAGPVGENVADRIIQGGLTVAIVEAELVGGECSYWGAGPTKALLRDAAALRAVATTPRRRRRRHRPARRRRAVPPRPLRLPLTGRRAGRLVERGRRITLARGHGRIPQLSATPAALLLAVLAPCPVAVLVLIVPPDAAARRAEATGVGHIRSKGLRSRCQLRRHRH